MLNVKYHLVCAQSRGPRDWMITESNDKVYTVTDIFSEGHEPRCDCPAFSKSRTCKHIHQAYREICSWTEMYSEEKINDDETCPCCGGLTFSHGYGV